MFLGCIGMSAGENITPAKRGCLAWHWPLTSSEWLDLSAPDLTTFIEAVDDPPIILSVLATQPAPKAVVTVPSSKSLISKSPLPRFGLVALSAEAVF